MNCKLVILLPIVLLSFVSVLQAAVSVMKAEPSPGNPNECLIAARQLTVAIGEEKTTNSCTKLTCSKDENGQLTVQEFGCGAYEGPDCGKTRDLSKPYPACCTACP